MSSFLQPEATSYGDSAFAELPLAPMSQEVVNNCVSAQLNDVQMVLEATDAVVNVVPIENFETAFPSIAFHGFPADGDNFLNALVCAVWGEHNGHLVPRVRERLARLLKFETCAPGDDGAFDDTWPPSTQFQRRVVPPHTYTAASLRFVDPSARACTLDILNFLEQWAAGRHGPYGRDAAYLSSLKAQGVDVQRARSTAASAWQLWARSKSPLGFCALERGNQPSSVFQSLFPHSKLLEVILLEQILEIKLCVLVSSLEGGEVVHTVVNSDAMFAVLPGGGGSLNHKTKVTVAFNGVGFAAMVVDLNYKDPVANDSDDDDDNSGGGAAEDAAPDAAALAATLAAAPVVGARREQPFTPTIEESFANKAAASEQLRSLKSTVMPCLRIESSNTNRIYVSCTHAPSEYQADNDAGTAFTRKSTGAFPIVIVIRKTMDGTFAVKKNEPHWCATAGAGSAEEQRTPKELALLLSAVDFGIAINATTVRVALRTFGIKVSSAKLSRIVKEVWLATHGSLESNYEVLESFLVELQHQYPDVYFHIDAPLNAETGKRDFRRLFFTMPYARIFTMSAPPIVQFDGAHAGVRSGRGVWLPVVAVAPGISLNKKDGKACKSVVLPVAYVYANSTEQLQLYVFVIEHLRNAKLFRQRTSANAATYKPVVVAVDGFPGAAAVIELAPRPGVHQVFFVVWRCIFHLARNMAASKRVPLSWLPISTLLIPLTKAMTWSAFNTLMADLLNAKHVSGIELEPRKAVYAYVREHWLGGVGSSVEARMWIAAAAAAPTFSLYGTNQVEQENASMLRNGARSLPIVAALRVIIRANLAHYAAAQKVVGVGNADAGVELKQTPVDSRPAYGLFGVYLKWAVGFCKKELVRPATLVVGRPGVMMVSSRSDKVPVRVPACFTVDLTLFSRRSTSTSATSRAAAAG